MYAFMRTLLNPSQCVVMWLQKDDRQVLLVNSAIQKHNSISPVNWLLFM